MNIFTEVIKKFQLINYIKILNLVFILLLIQQSQSSALCSKYTIKTFRKYRVPRALSISLNVLSLGGTV